MNHRDSVRLVILCVCYSNDCICVFVCVCGVATHFINKYAPIIWQLCIYIESDFVYFTALITNMKELFLYATLIVCE